jgi:hypothetical protein
MSKEILDAASDMIRHFSTSDELFEIILDGKPMSFGGERLFRSNAGAKMSIQRNLKFALSLDNTRTPGKEVLSRELNGGKSRFSYPNDAASGIIDQLIQSGRLVIREYNPLTP